METALDQTESLGRVTVIKSAPDDDGNTDFVFNWSTDSPPQLPDNQGLNPTDPFLLADGGLWANDPSFVAYVEATGKLKVPADEVRILSIGSGVGEHYYSHENADARWGAMTGWGGPQIIDLILNLQSKTAGNMLSHLPKGDYLRLNFKRDYKLSLDDVGILPDLKGIAERLFADEFKKIKGFFEGGMA